MKIYGYVRVSSMDQNEDRQLLAMQEKAVPEYREKLRPELPKLMKTLRSSDIIKSVGRLSKGVPFDDWLSIRNRCL